jgi:hypothetical protein
MSINQKTLALAAFVLLGGLTACNDDEKGTDQLSKDEAKSKLAEFNASANDDLDALTDAEGLQAVQDFFDLVETDDPFAGRIGTDKKKIRAFFQEKGRAFRQVFVTSKAINGRTQGTEPFDFTANSGTYVWDPELVQFTKTGESNIVEILFPTEGSSTNNAKLQLTAYSEVQIYDDFMQEYSYEPELLKAALFVDNVKKASLDLQIEWDENGFPLSADITMMVTPFTATISFDMTASTASTLSVSLLRDQETLIATSVTVKYGDSSKSEESLEGIEGYVQFLNLKLEGQIDVTAADAEEVDWNDIIDAALYSDGEKIGDIVFVDENGEAIPYLEYADGSKEKLETVLQPVYDKINELRADLDTNG